MRARLITVLACAFAILATSLHASPARAVIPVTLTVVASPSTVYVGDTINITVTVSPNPGACDVLLGAQNVTLNPATGSATVPYVTQSATTGTHFDAIFVGCGEYGQTGWVSSNEVVVLKHPISISLTSPSSVGRGDAFSVSVALNPVPQDGLVRIREVGPTGIDGVTQRVLAQAAVLGSSPISFDLPAMLPGSYALRAEFYDSNRYVDKTTAARNLNVFDRPTTTTVTAGPDPSKWGEPVNVMVNVSPEPDRGSIVEVRVDGVVVGRPALNPNGVATLTVVPGAPGQHTITAEFGNMDYQTSTDRWGPSEDIEPHTVTSTKFDTNAPTGTVSINSGAGTATSLPVGLTFNASDASGIAVTEISNDGDTWFTYAGYFTPFAWDLCDPAYGGTATDGTKTVHVRWTDPYGNTSTISTDTILLDFFGPIGTVTIFDGSGSVISTTVEVDVPAADAGSAVTQVALSNDGTTWTTFPYAPTIVWTLNGGDGIKTVHAKWKDARGHWSDVSTDTIRLDTTAPAGTVGIAGGAPYATGAAVTVAVGATDGGTGLSQVALSNDGTSWTTRAYGATQSWTLAAGDGTKTVHVKWKDAAGNWSAVKTDTIVLDTAAPSATAPGYAFVGSSTSGSGGTPTKFTWAGSDATSGIARYEAAISTDGGAWSLISTSLTAANLTRNLTGGHSYRLRVRAVDKAGLAGAWVYGPTFQVTSYQETSTRITYTGTWTRPTSTSYWGSYLKYATASGAKASFTFTGKAFAWVGCVGPTRGSAKIYVNGVLVTTVSTYAATTSCKRVLYATTWSTAISRKISIVVSGTAGHARVDLDALVTGV